MKLRTVTEDFSRDSFENLLFAMCRFFECTGRRPWRVTVSGWDFKQERLEPHRAALRFPRERFEYVAVNSARDPETARAGERENALEPYRLDPYGTHRPLSEKRAKRNPFGRTHDFAVSCPEATGLLAHTGPKLYPGPPPW